MRLEKKMKRIILLFMVLYLCFFSITSMKGKATEMDIKTKIENFLINLAMRPHLSELGKETEEEKKAINSCAENILAALQKQDADQLKSLFAPNAVNEIGENAAVSMINSFLSYFNGESVSLQSLTHNASQKIDHGKRKIEIKSSMKLSSAHGKYKMAVKLVPNDDFDADNVGLWSIYIISGSKDTLPDDSYYFGDNQFRTGIYFDIPENET